MELRFEVSQKHLKTEQQTELEEHRQTNLIDEKIRQVDLDQQERLRLHDVAHLEKLRLDDLNHLEYVRLKEHACTVAQQVKQLFLLEGCAQGKCRK